MNPTQSTNLRRGESRSTYNENDRLIMKLRNEEEKLRRRREWMRQQELKKQHKILKEQMILNWKIKHAEAMKSKQTSSRHSYRRSKSRSKSPSYHRHRERSSSRASKSDTLFKKLDGSSGVPLFKGPEGTQISSTELRQIKIDIRRNIPAKGPVTELQRDILNPEDVILKRREGKMLHVSWDSLLKIVSLDNNKASLFIQLYNFLNHVHARRYIILSYYIYYDKNYFILKINLIIDRLFFHLNWKTVPERKKRNKKETLTNQTCTKHIASLLLIVLYLNSLRGYLMDSYAGIRVYLSWRSEKCKTYMDLVRAGRF